MEQSLCQLCAAGWPITRPRVDAELPPGDVPARFGNNLRFRWIGEANRLVAVSPAGAYRKTRAQRALHGYLAVTPPSAAMIWPVMNAQASEANNATRPFKSSGPPTRLSGALFATSSPIIAMTPWVILVGKNPGAMAFTLMLYCAHSTASARVKFTTPPFVVL